MLRRATNAEDGHGAAAGGGALLGTFSFGTLRVAFGEAVESPVRPTNAIPPHAANEGQREFLCDMVEHALGAYGDQADSGDAAADHWQTVRRVFLVGVAGTGKTFTIDLLANALVAITGKAGALAAFCPTGAAAGAARGRTIDAALGVRRSRATYVELEGDRLAKLQDENTCTHCAVLDEAWMIGCKLFGHVCCASKQLLRGGAMDTDTDYFGSQIGQVVLCGDPKQLPPVKDKPCFTPLEGKDASSLLACAGRQAYNNVKRCWLPTQPVRQKEGEFSMLSRACETVMPHTRRGCGRGARWRRCRRWRGRPLKMARTRCTRRATTGIATKSMLPMSWVHRTFA